MPEKISIGTMVFGGGESTLGMSIIARSIKEKLSHAQIVENVDCSTAKNVKYLLVSLYWWKDIYSLVNFLKISGIDPRKRRPIIIIGGMAALNPFVLTGYYHYAVLGDGENVAPILIQELEKGNQDVVLTGVIADGQRNASIAPPAEMSTTQYIEQRTNKTARIEIARGCRHKCPFCQLSAIKPYREMPFEIIKHLIITCPTKNVALFAPDRGSHSAYQRIEDLISKIGKRNTGSDIRIDKLFQKKTASTVRFGLEAFTENKRRKIKGIKNNDELIKSFEHLFQNIKTPKNKLITTATIYIIADLPGERELKKIIEEFNSLLSDVDTLCNRKFTIFLSIAGFTPSAYTRMAKNGIEPYTEFNDYWKRYRIRLKNITIATRGGVYNPATRLAHMLTIRGDERARKIIYLLGATSQGKKLLINKNKKSAGEYLEKLLQHAGYSKQCIYAELGANEPITSDRIILDHV